ncbi:pyruvate dehydrogenase complex dihydrolipoamide acetyltransferase [Rhodoplanes serenus]|uniref:Acetyltransferase component of pyruvate dehydrogenase complex n=1 Tax=Rhodoplanes serenus TaxID=200615 RepID=A0A9X4XJK6_9BRAD|nr:pyruvate dehydrogenase complex dihydrolipoamide acetyltransferase [Rhodoplanes serenus]MTW16300.1 pyruvate dehydrogenase complex dihydrolipoamide acetyltransferase [Rhodoplanes serenus]
MPINILMPALSPTMEKGNLAKWLKKEGDKVRSGDIIAEIETDKATMEYEAVDEGTIAKILVPAGTADVSVNAPIAVLAVEGEVPSVVAGQAGSDAAQQGGAKPAEPAAAAPAKPQAAKPAPATDGPAVAPQDAAGQQGQGGEAPAGAVRWEGLHGAPHEAAAHGAAARDTAAHPANGERRLFASPLARRLAKEAGIDLSRVEGSGPHGRVVARDIAAAKEGRGLRAAPAAAQPSAGQPGGAPVPLAAATPSDAAIKALYPDGSYEFVPHDQMRRIIAQRLTLAKQTIPHFYLTVTCTIDTLLAAREAVNAAAPKDKDGKPAWKLSVNDFVIKALALALKKVPDANVTWTDGGLLKHKASDVAVAVAIPGGLITPVVRNADTKSLSVISAEMKDFAARARARRLKPEEYQGGATAVSNLGMYGIEEFSAVINPPHATILAVGAAAQVPIVEDGAVTIATQMKLTLSTDHRAVDGALGAELIGAIKGFIENPVMMVV